MKQTCVELSFWLGRIKQLCSQLRRDVRIMTLCGTHENTVAKYGIRDMLPGNIQLLPGPGCPVCVLPDEDLQKAMYLIQNEDIVLTTFGDMARVPYNSTSLYALGSSGYDVRVVYSIFDAVALAERMNKPVVHLAIGFETTMPSTALVLTDKPDNFYVLCAHRFFLPAIEHLLRDESMAVDGFINPGHVSAIIGAKSYESISKKFKIPQVVSGFEPQDVLESLCILLELIVNDKAEVRNQYSRVVRYEGNPDARRLLNRVFTEYDGLWRGLGIVKRSGARIKPAFKLWDAEHRFRDVLESLTIREDPRKRACRCGEVLKGLCTPRDCPLFLKSCTPRDPVGPCMVSVEGACNIWANFGSLN